MTKLVQHMHLFSYFYVAGTPRGHKWDTNEADVGGGKTPKSPKLKQILLSNCPNFTKLPRGGGIFRFGFYENLQHRSYSKRKRGHLL